MLLPPQVTARLLSADVDEGGCGFGNLEHFHEERNHDPRLVAIFPLHNRATKSPPLQPLKYLACSTLDS